MSNTTPTDRLIVVSNRLPYVCKRDGKGWRAEPGSGGLISALKPVLTQRGGTWLGWPGTSEAPSELDEVLAEASRDAGYRLQSVHLDAEEVHNFYNGFSNEVIWPLFHDLQSVCNFEPAYWRTYCAVNRKFARAIATTARPDDFVWVHDYHLMNVGAELRALGCTSRTGFFLHIPFPSLDLFSKLPWSVQVIEALLQFDLVGFQTSRDRRNFLQCARALAHDVEVDGKGQVVRVRHGERTLRVGTFPISIDYEALAAEAKSPAVGAKARELRAALHERTVVLGIDRLDYTKGIPHGLKAFQSLLHRYPALQEKLSLIQVVVPSREGIPEYDDLKSTIEQLVGKINGEFMRPGGWVPIWYVYGSLTETELLAYYRAADIALVTPLRDGMNLVAKEFCACSIEENCSLILSEFAGAAAQLRRDALLVNPYDVDGVANALHRAYGMTSGERTQRMRAMRDSIRRHDVFWWVETFLAAARPDADVPPDTASGARRQRPGLAAVSRTTREFVLRRRADGFFPDDALSPEAG